MRLFHPIVYSNLFVALVLCSLTFSSYFILTDLLVKWYVPLSVFLGSFVLYNFHRLYKIDFIPINRLEKRHKWVLKHSNSIKILMSLAVFFLMLILPNFNTDTIVWLVPAGLVSIGYTIPVIPTKHGWQRFRDIPFTKPMIIALVVTYLTMAYPIFEQLGIGRVFSGHYLPLLGERMLFILAVTIPFDVRDIVNDKDAGLSTLGTQLGFNQARSVAYTVAAAWMVVILWRWVQFDFASIFLLQLSLTGTVLMLALRTLNPSWKDMGYILVFEGMIVLYSLVYVMGSSFQTLA